MNIPAGLVQYNYFISLSLFLIGVYTMITRKNLIKKRLLALGLISQVFRVSLLRSIRGVVLFRGVLSAIDIFWIISVLFMVMWRGNMTLG